MKIVMSVAHTFKGNAGCGAEGFINESDYSREVVPKIARELENEGHEVKIIRIDKSNSYEYEDCHVRARLANEWGADLYVEVHLNSAGANAHGVECYVSTDSATSCLYAKRITDSIVNTFKFTDRTYGVGYKREDFIVLTETNMAAVLVEAFFCTNEAECNKANSADMARAIASGILNKQLATIVKEEATEGLQVTNWHPQGKFIQGNSIRIIAPKKPNTLYKFILVDRELNTWTTVQDYNENNIADCKVEGKGTHSIIVHYKAKNSDKDYDNFDSTGVYIEAIKHPELKIKVTNYRADGKFIEGNSIKIVADKAEGYEYKFYICDRNTNTWKVIKDYSEENTLDYKVEEYGTHTIALHYRRKGSQAKYEAFYGLNIDVESSKIELSKADFDKLREALNIVNRY